MSRNGSGTMSVPNSFSPNTTAQSGQVNANFSDIATEITNSLPRDGQAGMTGQFKAANGTLAAPGMAFASDPDTGFRRKSGDTMGIVAGGVEVGEISSAGIKDANGVVQSGIPTGAMMMYGIKTAPAGWVRLNGRTIGSGASGAAERANADCEALYALLWDNYANDECPVTGGRGVSASADWLANKPIALPDYRCATGIGLADMGNSASAALDDVTASPTVNGKRIGAATATLARANLPNVAPAFTGQSSSVTTESVVKSTSVVGYQGGGSVITFGVGPAAAASGSVTPLGTVESLNGNVAQTKVGTTPLGFLTSFIMKL